MGAAALVSPSGEIKMWPTATAPTGFLLCDGSNVSRTIYAALFTVIGTTFGAGDGTTTFTVPNFKNRFPVGSGDLYSAGATGGSKDAVAISHTHTVTDPGHDHSYTRYSSLLVQTGSSTPCWSGTSTQNTSSETTGISIDSAGESGTNKNLPPYLSVYFIIKT
jgi:microcystin-dependent protein